MMNKALLAKLGWRVITGGKDEWCNILRNKYGMKEEGMVEFAPKHRASLVW